MFDSNKYLLILLLPFFLTFSCFATPSGKKFLPVPDTADFRVRVNQTNKILKALHLENREMPKTANQYWNSFPDSSIQVKAHQFRNYLFFNGRLLGGSYKPNVPETEESWFWVAQYYRWQKQWDLAIHAVDKMDALKPGSTRGKFERIQLYLYQGDFDKVLELLKSFNASSLQERLQYEVHYCWFLVLTGEYDQALRKMEKLEEEFLYLPHSSLIFPGINQRWNQAFSQLKRSLTRFPGNSHIFEEFFMLYWQRENLESVIQFIKVQKPGYRIVRELISLESFLKDQERPGGAGALLNLLKNFLVTPDHFTKLANYAIEKQDWQLLGWVATILEEKYPDLLDGKLYLSEYYLHTNQLNRREELLAQLKLSIR